MHIQNSSFDRYNVSFNGLFKKRDKSTEVKENEAQTTTAPSSSAFRSILDSGILAKAKLYLNKDGFDYSSMPVVNKINALEESISNLSDEELKNKTAEFKEILSKRPTSKDRIKDLRLEKEALDEILPEAYAVVRETSKRVLGKRPYDVQLMGGIALHNGQIAEIRTGEGKTITAMLPAYLNALTGKGVHVITANNYLAERDAEITGKVYDALGLTVGVVKPDRGDIEGKKKAYSADITYGTNVDIGFDYLTDNTIINPKNRVQRPYNFAIIDEADDILIDKATNPLIKGEAGEESTKMVKQMNDVANKLEKDTDYTVDEKHKNITLTEEGEKKAEELLGVSYIYDGDGEQAYLLKLAVMAKELFHKDKEYIVKNGRAICVDENTGRLMPTKRLSVHQAIEAKEGLKIRSNFHTIASVTMQNFFNLYPRISGMTGTGSTEKEELGRIYGLNVSKIPTNKPDIRIDSKDEIYKTEKSKLEALTKEIKEINKTGRPILIGTTNIEKSEKLSEILTKQGIAHNVLNAKDDEKEAEIVAQAGRLNSVTIATNMAGRGTNILLGGDPEFLAKAELEAKNITPENTPNYKEIKKETIEAKKKITNEEYEKVKDLGGLHIIGTEKHESVRIDNQLRGRAGRQGEPGTSKFFVSLEDNIMHVYGKEEAEEIMQNLPDDGKPIDSKEIQQFVDKCQKRAESMRSDTRKRCFEYDSILNIHRQNYYKQRREILESNDLRPQITNMIKSEIDGIISSHISPDLKPDEYNREDLASIIDEIKAEIPQLAYLETDDITELTYDGISSYLKKMAVKEYNNHIKEISDDAVANQKDAKSVAHNFERTTLLTVANSRWMDFLNDIDALRKGIGLVAYAKKKPLVEFHFESTSLYEEATKDIRTQAIKELFATSPKIAEKKAA